MQTCRFFWFSVVAAIALTSASTRADLIALDLCPAGTTSNQNIFGTTVSGGVASWGTYREYQFQLLTSAGSASFDQFSILLSAQLRQSTSASNSLRASLWSGTPVANPLLADALTTISVSNSLISASGFSSKVALTGGPFTPQVITATTSPFYFRVWAEGANSNEGYQTKMASLSPEMQLVTMTPNAVIDGGIGVDIDGNGSIDTVDPLSEVAVPEIDPAGMGSVVALVTGGFGLLERRRRKRS